MPTSPITLLDGSVHHRAVPEESTQTRLKRQEGVRETTRLALAKLLNDYASAVQDLEVWKAKLQTSAAEKETALHNPDLSDDQVLLKAHAYRRNKEACDERENLVCKALAAVNFDGIAPFNREYTGLYNEKFDRVRDMLRGDIIAAACWPIGMRDRRALESVDGVLGMSVQMVALRELAPKPLSSVGPPRWQFQSDPSTYWVQFATELLEKFDRLMQLKEKI